MKFLMYRHTSDNPASLEYMKWSDNTGDMIFLTYKGSEEKQVNGHNAMVQTWVEDRNRGYFFKTVGELEAEGWKTLETLHSEPGDD